MPKANAKKYKIVFISSQDAGSRTSSSGMFFYISRALKNHIGDIDYIYNLKPQKNVKSIILNLGFVIRYLVVKVKQLLWKLRSRNYQWERTRAISRYYAKKIGRELKDRQYDFIFAEKASIEIAYLDTKMPILSSDDSTFKSMVDFYDDFCSLTPASIKEGNLLEKRAIDNATCCIYHCRWAAEAAIRDYGVDRKKVGYIHPGPNIDSSLLPDEGYVRNKTVAGKCNLLLVGVNWRRKGCDIAIEIVKRLNSMGIDSKLTICGCKPPSDTKISDYVEVIPFLDKNKAEEAQRIASLYKDATYFIFPTRAECLGMVLVEACAFGLPILATDVGGVSEVVRDGINGFIFSLSDNAEKYAEAIARSFKNPAEYKKMSLNSYEMHKKEFNWEEWARRLRNMLPELSSSGQNIL